MAVEVEKQAAQRGAGHQRSSNPSRQAPPPQRKEDSDRNHCNGRDSRSVICPPIEDDVSGALWGAAPAISNPYDGSELRHAQLGC